MTPEPGTSADPETASVLVQSLPSRIVFFDGVCVLCDGLVRALLAVDRGKALAFASLQGETAARIRRTLPDFPGDLETIVYLEDNAIYLRSRAILKIARLLPYPWRLFSVLGFLPSALLDLGYRFVARVRYTVFGKHEACMVPSPEDRERFLP